MLAAGEGAGFLARSLHQTLLMKRACSLILIVLYLGTASSALAQSRARAARGATAKTSKKARAKKAAGERRARRESPGERSQRKDSAARFQRRGRESARSQRQTKRASERRVQEQRSSRTSSTAKKQSSRGLKRWTKKAGEALFVLSPLIVLESIGQVTGAMEPGSYSGDVMWLFRGIGSWASLNVAGGRAAIKAQDKRLSELARRGKPEGSAGD